MEETRYLISDAAAKVAVEAHVLRYWEEELELAISRTELGHRYYTEEDIRTFQNIKELKERGFQLKAIKVLLPELKKRELKHDQEEMQEEMARLEKQISGQQAETEAAEQPSGEAAPKSAEADEPAEPQADPNSKRQILSGKDSQELVQLGVDLDKLAGFESIMETIFRQTLQENNQELEDRISDSVLRGMDVLMQIREEKEEARYRQLDESIRAHQKKRKMVAAAREETEEEPRKRKFPFRKRL